MWRTDAYIGPISQEYGSRLLVEDPRELLSVQVCKIAFQNVTHFREDLPVRMLDVIFGRAAVALPCVSPMTNCKKFLERSRVRIMRRFRRGDAELPPSTIFLP